MKLKPQITIFSHFSNIHDQRVERRKLHKLIDILTISIGSISCGRTPPQIFEKPN